MNEAQFREALRAIASQEIPESMNSWNQIERRAAPRARQRSMVWSLIKIGTVFAAVLLALMSIAVGYAVFRQWSDPGMQSVEEAGMITPVQMTAIATSYVTPSAPATDAAAASNATPIATAQSGEASVVLEEMYADGNRIALVYTLYNIPPEMLESRMPDPSQEVWIDYMINTGLSYPDGSLFNASTGGWSEPGPVAGSKTIHTLFDHNEPIPTDGNLALKFAINIQRHTMTNDGQGGFSGGGMPDIVYSFEFNLNLTVIPATIVEINQTQTANGVTMTLTTLSISPAGTKANLCYNLPPGHVDWQPRIKLTVNGEEGVFQGGGWSNVSKQEQATATSICLEMSFATSHTPGAKHIVVTVDRLQVSPDESLSDEVIQRANERLAAQGIEVNFTFGNHGMGWEIIRKPEGMLDEEVGMAVWDALSDQVVGPWVFEVDVP